MAEWKPTIGKWHDEDNYNMVKPAWRRMLDAASEYKEVKTVQTVLTQLGHRNITAYDIQEYVIGYLLHQKDVDLKNYMPDSMISKIRSFSLQSQNIYDYTVLVLKECHISDAVIEEFIEEIRNYSEQVEALAVWTVRSMQTTCKLYDTDSHLTTCKATVLHCEYEDARKAYAVVLDRTVFFPEGGGQFADTGFINGAEIFDVQLKNEVIFHYTKENILDILTPGTAVTCQIDRNRRFDFMQQHSAEHILSGLVHSTYGYNNVGFHLGLTETTLDFDGPLTAEQIVELEIQANEVVYRNIAFDITFPDKDTLANLEYRSKKELDGEVRIVTLPGYDVCACCAPHVYRTGEIGTIKIVSYMAHRGGMRLTVLCGSRAIADYQAKQHSVEQISALLSAKQPEVAAAVSKTKADQQALTLRINALQKMVLEAALKSLPSPDTTEHVFLFQKDLDTKAIRDAVNELCTRYTGYCGIFVGDSENGYTFVLGSASRDCREAASLLREAFGAKGGGSARMIQGSVVATEESIREILH